MNALHLTSLVENTAAGRGIRGEHGLSFWIEAGGRRILFDAGQSGLLADNAQRLGIDLRTVNAVVLSHGHYDHAGGLESVLAFTGPVDAYAHPDALKAKFSRHADGSSHAAGMPDSCLKKLRDVGRFKPVETSVEIDGGLRLTGPVPRKTEFEDVGGAFFLDVECRRPDPLTDDQAAFFETEKGVVVILGCAHAGIVNTLMFVRKLTGNKPIRAVVGGAHLVSANPERMDKTIEAMRDIDVQRLFPVHCTGYAAFARLLNEFPGRVEAFPAGSSLEFS